MMQNHITHWGKRYHFDNCYSPPLALSQVELRQAGEIIAGNGHEIPEHLQVCMEISYVVSGECTFYVDGNPIHAHKGDLHVIAPGVRHKIVADGAENLRMAYIAFLFLPKTELSKELQDFYQSPPAHMQTDFNDSRMLFEQLLEEIYAGQPCFETILDACVNHILVHVWRIFQLGGAPEIKRIVEEKRLEQITGHTVFQALRYIDNHIFELSSISQMAKDLRYNPSYLSRVFHEKTGITLRQYIEEKKAEQAKILLQQGMSVSETAARLGYGSSQSFHKMFVRTTQKPPSAYRLSSK